MSNAFSRSWEITKLSFSVINKDRELLLFPIFSGIFSLIFILMMVVPTVITFFISDRHLVLTASHYILWFIAYFGISFIATFFNVCTVYTTKKRFEGGNATFMESISFSMSKIHLIFSWSVVSATVGIILRMLDNLAERMGSIGKMIMGIMLSILGMTWSIVTIFVVPGMVYNNLGPFAAIKKSINVLKKTWGESLIRYYGLGLVEFIVLILVIIVSIPLVMVMAPLGSIALAIALVVAILAFVLVILLFGIANAVFNTALYVYADTGKVPQGFSKETMKGAFASNKE